jgi:oligogalacturonide lyase
MRNLTVATILCSLFLTCGMEKSVKAQIGKRFPSERKVVTDPVTGAKLTFLTSKPAGDGKIYQTHSQWTSDGKWIIFRSDRVKGEAMAVNESTGDIVQVSEGGYAGMLNVARKSMKLYFMRSIAGGQVKNSLEIVEVDLGKLFADSKAGTLKEASVYQRVCGKTPPELDAGGDMALDCDEEWVYFRVGASGARKLLPEGTKMEGNFGPRNLGAGPSGIARMNIRTGETKPVVAVPFQVGHIQSNPWVSNQVVFCWETGGKAPQRTWIVNADGTGLRPLYPEASYEWITHEAVITKDEVAFAMMGDRKIPNFDGESVTGPGANTADTGTNGWGYCATREKPSGLGILNINTREMYIAGQIPKGSGFWHVTGSPDGRFVAGDCFDREVYLIDRRNHEMMLLTAGHKRTAADHIHPTFSPEGDRLVIQTAMLSADDKTMNICVVPVPKAWLKRTFK